MKTEIEILRQEVANLKKQVDIYSREINEMIDMEVSEAIKLEKLRKEFASLERQLEESKEGKKECNNCRFFKAETYHDKMWCRDCQLKNHFEFKPQLP